MSSLYRRNGIYWLSFRSQGRSYCISLGTRDRSTALYLKAKKDQALAEGKEALPGHNRDIAAILEEYRLAFEHHKTKDTHSDDINRIKRFLGWANLHKFSQFTEKKLQDYLTYRISTEKISLNTANRVVTNLKTFLNFAVRRRHILENPLQHFKKYQLTENPGRFLSKEEIKDLLTAARNPGNYADGKPTLYPVLATALYTGMRRQEVFNLEWQNIDFNRNILTIVNKPGFTTKTKKFRTIPLAAELKNILWSSRRAGGKCFDVTNSRRIFERIIRDAGLKEIGWREIRRTFGSHLAMNGVSLLKIAKWYGHSTPQVTYKHYAHLAPEASDSDIDRLTIGQ